MRLVRAGLVLGVALVLGAGATAAHAYWKAQSALTAGTVVTGDMNVAAAWSPSAPAWAAIYPGESRTANLVVSESGSTGTTLQWTLQVSGAVAAASSAYGSVQIWVGACGTGTLVYSPGGGSVTYPASGSLLPTDTVTLCVQVSMAANAPAAAQNAALAPTITVTANQKGS
jgi:hypothetical protein